MVRTRIAPSPTGAPHIGTAYIALFNYAFAKHHGGQFILRIEDTDQTRSRPEYESAIIEALRWMGLPWDEGPDIGGPHGPYRQQERTELYREHTNLLIEKKQAYRCFCTPERLTALRQQQEANRETIGYDGHCSTLSDEESERRFANNEKHVIRLRTPSDGECLLQDRFRGEVRIPWSMVDDQILLKADGFPTYHLANVVDDHHMQITHVIRGEEWISSTPKHLLLYEAFDWTPPSFAHLPLLRNPDKSKLSKRKNPTGILFYRQAGYLPEALLNYLGLMAYRPSDGEELFDLETMVRTFDIDRVSLGGPIFDLKKLQAFNGKYIREMDNTALQNRLQNWMLNDATWQSLLTLAKPRLNQLTDFVPMSAFVFADRLSIDTAALTHGFEDPLRVVELLQIIQWRLETMPGWETDAIKACLEDIACREEIAFKKLLRILFVVISGSSVSLPLFESMVLLGRELSLRRMHYARETLEEEGVTLSGKARKKLEKSFTQRYSEDGPS